jgi:hypothetical protein
VFVQYGAIGAGVVGFAVVAWKMLGRDTARSDAALAREVERADRLEDENRTLNAAMQDKAIPALLAAANAISECTALIRDIQRDRERDYARLRRDGDTR